MSNDQSAETDGSPDAALTHDGRKEASSVEPLRFWDRVREHKVVQWTLAYAAAAYTLLHVVEMVGEALDWPHLVARVVTLALFLGAPVAATLAWYHGHRALRRISGPELAILTVLLFIAATVLWFTGRPKHEHASATVAAEDRSSSALRTPVVPASEKSIAVLPFADMSEKHDQEYFADGLAEEIIDELAHIPELKILGRTSSFQFRNKAEDVKSIGTALGAAYVLEGSVRRTPERLRVTAQLIDTHDGTHRWSNTYDAPSADVFHLQDTIAADLARTLEVTVASTEPLQHKMKPAAYELFLQAKQLADTNSEDSLNSAIALLEDATRRDPESSRIWSELGFAYANLGLEGWAATPKDAFGSARRCAERALALDGKNGQAHADLGIVAMAYDWDWAVAERELGMALSLSQRDSETLVRAGDLASGLGDRNTARQRFNEALAKDPLSADAEIRFGVLHLLASDYAKAEQHFRRGLQIRPQWGSGHYYLAVSLLMQNKLQDALREAELETPGDGKYQATAEVLYALHRQQESDAALQQAIAINQSNAPSSIARVYAFRGQAEEALQWLDRAYDYRDEDLFDIKGDPHFRNMELEPRYRAFLRKMNLPE